MDEKIEKIREQILDSQEKYGNELGIIYSVFKVDYTKKSEVYAAGTRAEFELSKELGVPYGIRKEANFDSTAPNGVRYSGGSTFKTAEEATSPKDKEAIEQRKRRMEQLRQSAKENPEMYDEEGQIRVEELDMDIPMTQRELIDAGLDPKNFGWKSLEQIKEEANAKVTPKTISKATSDLPTRVINQVRQFFSRGKDDRNNGRGE